MMGRNRFGSVRRSLTITVALLATLVPARHAGGQTACGSLQCITLSAKVFELGTLTQVTANGGTSFDISPASGFTASNFGGATSGAWNVPTSLTVTARTNHNSNVRLYMTRTGTTGCAISAADITYGTTSATRTTAIPTTISSGTSLTGNFRQTTTTVTLWFRVAGMTWTGDPPNSCSLPITFKVQ